MCYKSPGPRCSAYAKKKLIEAKERLKGLNLFSSPPEVYHNAKQAVADAELDYDSTPAGQKYLQLRIDQTDGKDSKYAERLANGKKLRKMQLKAIESKEAGDVNNHPALSNDWQGGELQPQSDTRYGWTKNQSEDESNPNLLEQYNKVSLAAAHVLTPDEKASLAWITSDGGPFINSKLATSGKTSSDEWTWENAGSPYQREKYGKEFTQKKIRHLNSAFKKYSLDSPAILYRGLNNWSLPDQLQTRDCNQDVTHKYLQERYPVGETVEVSEYMSASADPRIAQRFTGANRVVLEIKTKRAIPVGYVSTWDFHEREFVIDKGRKYKVLAILDGVDYSYENRRGEAMQTKSTVVQLEEI